jgi:hypothetical protein
MMVAMVVKPSMLSNGCQQTKSLMRLVLFTEPEVTITEKNALLNLSVTTAHQAKDAGLKMTTRSITLKNMDM